MRLPDYKPVPVPLRAAVIHLGRPLLNGSSDLPGSSKGRAAPPPLFGLAPRGVCQAGEITPAAVRSYRTISPLPKQANPRVDLPGRYIFCCTFRQALNEPARPLAGTLPCGDRTFLSQRPTRNAGIGSDCPSGSLTGLLSHGRAGARGEPECAARHY